MGWGTRSTVFWRIFDHVPCLGDLLVARLLVLVFGLSMNFGALRSTHRNALQFGKFLTNDKSHLFIYLFNIP